MSIRINRKLFYILVLIFAILVVRILEIKYDVEPEIENVGTIENGIVDGGSKCTFTFINGCFLKKSTRTGIKAFESDKDLSSSGDSLFLSTTISGWASRKSLL